MICIRCRINTEAVVSACGSILLAVDRDREWHVADVLAVRISVYHLGICPGAKYHGRDLASVDHALGIFPGSCGEVILCQSVCHCIVEHLVQCIWMCAIAVILERILCVKKLLVHVSRITGCRTCDLSVPLLHRPSVCVVRVERNDGRIVILDRLQCRDELIRCLRCLCNAGLCEDSLVVYNTLCITGRRNTVYQSVVIPGICELNLSFHLIECAVRQEILT